MNIPFHKTHIGKEEIESVVEALKSGWITMGPKVIEFEKKFKEYLGVDYAVSVNSATSALHLALKAVGVQAGDEVIIPTNTFIATAEVVTYFNAIPVLCDIEETTHNMDVKKIESLITDKTKAIIPVHFAGQPCDMEEISSIAKKHNLYVIEDAAHAFPSKYKEHYIGQLSDITCFSFYATKTLATGEGGMATTSNSEFAKSMKINRLHGISRDAWDRYTTKGSWFYQVVDNGFKYNMTDMNAALGLSQLKKSDLFNDQRKEIANRYMEAFSKAGIQTTVVKPNRSTSWHLFVIKVNNRNEFIEQFKSENIGCSVHFIPVHMHPYYQDTYNYKKDDYPIANSVFEKSVSLPIFPEMTDEEVSYVIEKVLKYAE